jgi:hypothetical protein
MGFTLLQLETTAGSLASKINKSLVLCTYSTAMIVAAKCANRLYAKCCSCGASEALRARENYRRLNVDSE